MKTFTLEDAGSIAAIARSALTWEEARDAVGIALGVGTPPDYHMNHWIGKAVMINAGVLAGYPGRVVKVVDSKLVVINHGYGGTVVIAPEDVRTLEAHEVDRVMYP